MIIGCMDPRAELLSLVLIAGSGIGMIWVLVKSVRHFAHRSSIKGIVYLLVIPLLLVVVYGVLIPRVHFEYRETRNACINNLRMIDAAKDEYVWEYGGKEGDTITWAMVSMYFKDITNTLYCTAPDNKADWRFDKTYKINIYGTDPICLIKPGTSADPDHALQYKAR